MCMFGMARWIKKPIDQTVKELQYKRKVSRKNLMPKYQAFCNHEIEKVNSKRSWKLKRAILKDDNRRKKKKDGIIRSFSGKIPIQKKPLVSLLKRKLLTILQECTRYRDSDSEGRWHCITCRCLLHLKNPTNNRRGTGGHCLDSKVNATALEEKNINLQCNACNKMQARGNMQVIEEYKRAIDRKYGSGAFNDIYISFKKRTTLSADRIEAQINLRTKRLLSEKNKKQSL